MGEHFLNVYLLFIMANFWKMPLKLTSFLNRQSVRGGGTNGGHLMACGRLEGTQTGQGAPGEELIAMHKRQDDH